MIADKAQNSSNTSYAHFLMLSYSILLTLITWVWIGFQFYWFSGCTLSLILLIVICVFLVFFETVSLLPLCNVEIFRKNATIFVVSQVGVYLAYLSWTLLASAENEECNPFTESTANTVLQVLVGLGFTTMTVISIATAS